MIARVTDEALLGPSGPSGLERTFNWSPARFLVHLGTNSRGVSRDTLCVRAGPFKKLRDALCSFDQAVVAYCVAFTAVRDPDRPQFRNIDVQLADARAAVGHKVYGLCSLGQAAQALIDGVSDPVTGVAATMERVLNDCLWQREIPNLPPSFDGCRFANHAAVRGGRPTSRNHVGTRLPTPGICPSNQEESLLKRASESPWYTTLAVWVRTRHPNAHHSCAPVRGGFVWQLARNSVQPRNKICVATGGVGDSGLTAWLAQ